MERKIKNLKMSNISIKDYYNVLRRIGGRNGKKIENNRRKLPTKP